ncbi:MAG: damage-control phosphatase ARMT1 family protein, partial [Ectothiorhodospira sp.]
KREATAAALAMQPRLEAVMQGATDPLQTAVRIAIAGNIIDYGAAETFDLDVTLERVLGAPFGIDGMAVLRRALGRVERLLYLADNAGETVFDRILIQALGRPVTYAVKAGPVLNDATLEEAREAGIHEVAEIVDTGCDAMGAPLELCSPAFRERFDAAELIIAKGQANYETLSDADAPVFFLLQAKCGVIADDLGVETGAVVARASSHLEARFGG